MKLPTIVDDGRRAAAKRPLPVRRVDHSLWSVTDELCLGPPDTGVAEMEAKRHSVLWLVYPLELCSPRNTILIGLLNR